MEPPLTSPETDLRPDDRILFLGIPDAGIVRAAAVRLTEGAVVALDPDDEAVRAARRICADLANVMIVWASPDEIPWQDAFFSQVFDTRDGLWPHPERVVVEIARVRSKSV